MSIFSKIQKRKVGTNVFNLSHDRKMSLKMGNLYPIFLAETVPGDKFSISTSQMLRFAPMIAPVMHRVKVYTHYFFVPNRILWPNWEDFITGGRDGNDTSVFPQMPLAPGGNGGLPDYLGIPDTTGQTASTVVSAIPFAVYYRIWFDYYRDQNVDSTVDILPLVDGDNVAKRTALVQLRPRAWRHDYFTSALPWTQRGPEATIPLGEDAPIVGDAEQNVEWNANATPAYVAKVNNNPIAANGLLFDPSVLSPSGVNRSSLTGDGTQMMLNNASQLSTRPGDNWYADLSTATAASINDLRRAFKLQEWLELNARGGSRYTEAILSHFGVRSSDGRLQRPEFLGGGQSDVVISEVLQMSTSNAAAEGEATTTPQGNMAGHGISVGSNGGVNYYCEEHGYIMGIMSVMPITAYQQGVPKHFRKFDKFDYFWPSFAHLGEQPIYNWELYNDADDVDNDEVFGYLPRYSEYKFLSSTVHGDMRDTLDFWTMGRIFENRPALNTAFVYSDPTDRIFAVQDGSDYLYAHVMHRVKARRKMPYFGTPNF